MACAQPAFLHPGTFEEQPSLVFSGDRLALTILTRGGAFAELTLADDPARLSPLWNPARQAREAGKPAPLGTSVGHFVCVDGFGSGSPEEKAAGLPNHGEAHLEPWHVRSSGKQGRTATVSFTVKLPLLQEQFTRTLRMVDGENVVYVESELESLLAFDRPVCWAEHATVGSPFLEPVVTAIDMPAGRCRTRPYDAPRADLRRLASGVDFTWPLAPERDGKKVDQRAEPADPSRLDHFACLLDPARPLVFVTALNTSQRLVFGYVFRRDEYPWVQNWDNFANGRRMTRGIEFSTQPYDVSRREVVETHRMFDTPVYRWLPAKGKIGSRFLLFYARTPQGMRNVDDVRLENGRIVIEDRHSHQRVTLEASLY